MRKAFGQEINKNSILLIWLRYFDVLLAQPCAIPEETTTNQYILYNTDKFVERTTYWQSAVKPMSL